VGGGFFGGAGGGGFGSMGGGGAGVGGYGAAAPPSAASSGSIDTRALIAAAKAAASANAGTMAATKTSRRLYIGSVSPTSESELTAFFNAVLSRAHAPGDYVLSTFLNKKDDKLYAFVEFKTIEGAGLAMQLDGVFFKGQQLRVRRPNDFNPAAIAAPNGQMPQPLTDQEAQKVRQVIDTYLHLEAILGQGPWRCHLACVIDQNVKWLLGSDE
jgi:splicing factor U2AF subunit